MTTPSNERLESRRLANVLRADIQAARYLPGTKLPSYRELANAYGMARNTVGVAIRLLASEGVVDIRAGSGAYVRDPSTGPPGRDVRAELRGLRVQLQRTKEELGSAQKTVDDLLEYLRLEETLSD